MNFEEEKAEKQIRKAAREFAWGEFDKELSLAPETRGAFPWKIHQKAAELGFVGIRLPEEAGGAGLGLTEAVIIAETFAEKDATIGGALTLAGFGAELLAEAQSPSVQSYLSRVAGGKSLLGLCFTEKNAEDEAATTFARRAGNEWILNGEKTYVVNAPLADAYLVLCQTGQGHGLFFVEGECEGVTTHPLGERLGLCMTPVGDVVLTDARVPQENLVAPPGRGETACRAYLEEAAVLFAALSLGIARGALDRALSYAKERVQFGQKLANFQVVRHKIADMAAGIEQSRYLTYAAAQSFTQRRRDKKLPPLAAWIASRTAVGVASEAVQIYGGYGYMSEYEVERFYRDAKTIEISLGNTLSWMDAVAQVVIGKVK